ANIPTPKAQAALPKAARSRRTHTDFPLPPAGQAFLSPTLRAPARGPLLLRLPWAFARLRPPFGVISSLCFGGAPTSQTRPRDGGRDGRNGRSLGRGAGPACAGRSLRSLLRPNAEAATRRLQAAGSRLQCHQPSESRFPIHGAPRNSVLLKRTSRNSCLGAHCCCWLLREQKPQSLPLGLAAGLQVEKNDEDQKIEQDGIKPEDKAHKAATKIQASFRGHITRKKLKGEKKGDAQAAEADEKKEEAPAADGVEKKEGEGSAATEAAPGSGAKADETGKAGETPSEEKKAEGAADAATEQAAPQAPAPSEEKAGSAETESATKAAPDNSPSSKAEDAAAKEEPKQADVPAAVTAAAATTPAAEEAAAQPPTETAESSQAEEKIEAVDETKPKESARQDEGKEEGEADQEHA
uniref:Neuromodulin n=1 Tax=Oryctolagus cuniculus TaxID=9986 RepID=A0A5F9CXN2_RABIT